MIARLSGTITDVDATSIIVDVSGIGYEVTLAPAFLAEHARGQSVTLYTYLAVRETSQELFGFSSREQYRFFVKLLSISGVGPKSALHIVSLGTVAELTSAIARGDTDYLTQVAGIGKKTAQRIVVELKGKIGVVESEDGQDVGDDATALVQALEQFGYSTVEAREAARYAAAQSTGQLEDKLKIALSYISNA